MSRRRHWGSSSHASTHSRVVVPEPDARTEIGLSQEGWRTAPIHPGPYLVTWESVPNTSRDALTSPLALSGLFEISSISIGVCIFVVSKALAPGRRGEFEETYC